jgi:diadenosine tetraphosphatase ApaH/serine/threonine PP2A family protein phosphatase
MDDYNPAARSAVEWTRRQRRPENLRYLAELPAGPVQANGYMLVHGAFQDEDEYVFVPEQAADALLLAPAALIFFGHTHLQGGFSLREAELEAIPLKLPAPEERFVSLPLDRDARYLLNPGSVGQPRDEDARTAFAIVDSDKSVVEFWRVPYDIHSVQERMRSASLPEALVRRLAAGH